MSCPLAFLGRDPAFRLARDFSNSAVPRVPKRTFVRGGSRTPARDRPEMPLRRAVWLPLLVTGAFLAVSLEPSRCQEPETPDWRMTLKTIRNGVHKIDTYINAALDLLGGEDGLCQYKCSDGYKPLPRYDYKPSPPNGCGSPLFGVHFDIGIPSMTKCCNLHDRCYDTCGSKKHDCDEQFQYCLSKICRDVQKTLGLPESVQACESTVQLVFDAVIHLGCKPYLDSQRAACICQYEVNRDL